MPRGEFDSGPYSEILSDGYDPYHAFISLMPYMVDEARRSARDEAVSWRRFHVGAALFAAELAGARTAVLAGANSKPQPDSPKYCAEMNVLDQAAAHGLEHVIGIVVAGTNDSAQIEAVTGIATPTLHPCDACLQKMAGSSLIEPETLIVTVALEEDVMQVHSYQEMALIYATEGTASMEYMTPSYPLDLENWPRRQFIYDRLASASDNLLHPPAVARLALTSVISGPGS
jgi:cytidine deaminase